MEESFTLPSSMINQLNEFSYGGFLLFCFDEAGSPRFYAQFDNELNMMALQKASEYWLEGVHDINSNNIKQQLSGPMEPPNEGTQDEWCDSDEDEDPFFS